MASPPDDSTTITVWRITQARHAKVAFSGEGARQHGGRFNSPGVPMVYTAGSRALATLELLVRLNHRRRMAPYVWRSATFPSSLLLIPDTLPLEWDALPYGPSSQQWGDAWIRDQRSLVLQVPSVVEPTEANYLINPSHPAIDKLKVGPASPVELDPRLRRG